MPLSFVLTLAAVFVVLLLVRLTVRRPRAVTLWARTMRPRDAALGGLGVIGLVLHCVVMFNRPLVGDVPGAESYANAVNQMGAVSIVLFVAPGCLLLAGLHAQRRPVLLVLAASLLSVGITMYDGGSLLVHLTSIFVSVVLLIITGTQLITGVGGPSQFARLRAAA